MPWSMIAALFAAALLAAAPVSAETAMPGEETIRHMFGLDADAEVGYRDADGKALTFAEFRSLLTEGNTATLTKIDERNAILQIGPSRPPAPAPSTVPDMTLADIEGRPLRIRESGGRETLINFFFAECAPCVEEVPALNDYARRNPELAVLAITFDPPAVAKGFVEEHGFEWPVAVDAEEFLDTMGVSGYPSYALLDADGELAGFKAGLGKGAGDHETTADDIADLVDELRGADGG